MLARTLCKVGGIIIAFLRTDAFLLKHPPHLFPLEVYGRHNDVARLLMEQLQDAFAKVGLHDVDAVPLKKRVHGTFLSKHRLALNHLPHAMTLQNVEHDVVKVIGVLSPMHNDATALQLRAKLLQIVSQVGNGVLLYLAGVFAQFLPFGQPRRHVVALLP